MMGVKFKHLEGNKTKKATITLKVQYRPKVELVSVILMTINRVLNHYKCLAHMFDVFSMKVVMI